MTKPRKARSAPKRRIARPGATSSVTLPADCTIAQTAAVKSRLAPLLGRASAITLDGNAVRRVDSAGLQLLAAFVRERRASGRSVAWRDVSPVFSAAATLLGLNAVLELTEQRS